MITAGQRDYIEDHAYVPEHILQYVTAISQAEPFLFEDFLIYVKKDHLIFVGYPLLESFEEKRMNRVLEEVIKCFKPESVSLTAPVIPSYLNGHSHPPSDHYYRLDLSALSISQKQRNMLNRAGRELSIRKGKNFDKEHSHLIDRFLKTHPVDEGTRFIFKRIGKYLSLSTTAWIFDARDPQGELIAFDIADFNPKGYAIYMFNFRSASHYVPGASDLLLSEVIRQAKNEKKKYLNLGLGINTGVIFFKKKWGGVPFLSYTFHLYRTSRKGNLEALLQKL
ncbi:MAG: hypothetical protein FJ107_00570 [Deltaproteobacteria bacterium]|nr:hypothetical protein [Deltaproteobacteria bacterium]